MQKKWWFIPILILALLILLNPSLNDFKEYSGITNRNAGSVEKKYNFLVCSVYTKSNGDEENKTYLGVLLNFIDISKQGNKQTMASDSTAVMIDSANNSIKVGSDSTK